MLASLINVLRENKIAVEKIKFFTATTDSDNSHLNFSSGYFPSDCLTDSGLLSNVSFGFPSSLLVQYTQ